MWWAWFPSSQKQPSELFCQKGVLKNFAKFTGKHLYQSLFFNKVVGLRPAALLKRRLWRRCFPVNFAKFLKTPLVAASSKYCSLSILDFWHSNHKPDMELKHLYLLSKKQLFFNWSLCCFPKLEKTSLWWILPGFFSILRNYQLLCYKTQGDVLV